MYHHNGHELEFTYKIINQSIKPLNVHQDERSKTTQLGQERKLPTRWTIEEHSNNFKTATHASVEHKAMSSSCLFSTKNIEENNKGTEEEASNYCSVCFVVLIAFHKH